jgi:hypothetical protein
MLTLALPADLEEDVLELLRAQAGRVQGFSILPAEGFGSGATMRSTIEQVRGRAGRRLILILMQQQEVAALLEQLRAELRSDDVAWWLSPIADFGRLG